MRGDLFRDSDGRPSFEPLEPRLLLSGDIAGSLLGGHDGHLPVAMEWMGQEVHVRPGHWLLNLGSFNPMQVEEVAGANAPGLASADIRHTTAGPNNTSQVDIRSYRKISRDLFLVETTPSTGYEDVLAAFEGLPGFNYLEPDSLIYVDEVIPDDPMFGDLWGLHNTGQTGGTPDADIDAPEAWEIATGDGSVVVGVIDTGVDYNHPDLASNMWVNPGEVAGDGVDNDGNGYVDDVYGWDFANDDSDPLDDNGHGTHCAGTIAAVGNNSIGVVGVNWNAKIMALKFLDAGGHGWTSDAVEAVNYAVMMRSDYGVNVRVLSNSWGGGSFSSALQDAIAACEAADMLFIASAGNDNSDTDFDPHYPSSYDNENLISLAATDHDDQLASFSNYGAVSVDLGAPGVGIISTIRGEEYGSKSGTSMATPHVAGTAGLIWSAHPEADYRQVRDIILGSVDPLEALAGKSVSGGRLNAHRALQFATQPYLKVGDVAADDDDQNGTAGNGDGIINPGETIGLNLHLQNMGLFDAENVTAVLSLIGQEDQVTVLDDTVTYSRVPAEQVAASSEQFIIQLDPAMPTPSEVSFAVVMEDGDGLSWTGQFAVPVYTSVAISGEVTLDGGPFAEVVVHYAGPMSGTALTQADGSYRLEVIAGTYILHATKEHCIPSDEVEVEALEDRSGVDFSFFSALVSGSVADAETGDPLENAVVSYVGAANGSVATDGQGYYEIPFATGRTVTLEIQASNRPDYSDSPFVEVTIPPGASDVDFSISIFEGYEVIDLGVEGRLPSATSVNNVGQVLGSVNIGGYYEPWVWENGTLTYLGRMYGLATGAAAINDSGVIVGSADSSFTHGIPHAFYWEDGTFTDIHREEWHTSRATDINDAGQIVGYFRTEYGDNRGGFIWQDGHYLEITHPGFRYISPSAINDLGQVVGWANMRDPSGEYPFLWQDGVLTILYDLEDMRVPYDINNHGQILFRDRIWQDGVVTALQPYESYTSINARQINNLGQAIGTAYAGHWSHKGGFLWSRDEVLNLRDMVRWNEGWTCVLTYGINDKGLLVGEAERNNDTNRENRRPILMVPSSRLNRPPVALDQWVEINTEPVEIELFGVDPEGNPVEFIIVEGPSHGTLTSDDGDAFILYAPEGGFAGTDSFTYRTDDGQQEGNVATVTIRVFGPNAAPQAEDDSVTAVEDASTTFDILANDADPDGDTLTVVGFTPPEHGTLHHLAEGVFLYTPFADFFGAESVTYTVSDGRGATDAGTINITVTGLPDDPVAEDLSVTLMGQHQSSIDITMPAFDVDEETLEYAVLDGPIYGSLTGVDGDSLVTYTPDPETLGAIDSFTFQVTDGTAESNVATVTIRVTAMRYEVTDLGVLPLPGYVEHQNARAINDVGQVAGWQSRWYSGGWYSHLYHDPWLWDGETLIGLDTLESRYGCAYGINELGDVVGFICDVYGPTEAVLWRDGEVIAIAGRNSEARDINDDGLIVGFYEVQGYSSRKHAFLYDFDNAEWTDLGTLGGQSSRADAINDLGQVVGWADAPVEDYSHQHAFVWEDGVMTDLGTLPGISKSSAVGINELGQIVGYVGGGSSGRAVLWDNGAIVDIGALGRWGSNVALDINNMGQIVGSSRADPYRSRATFWEDGVLYDLNNLCGDYAYDFIQAAAINDYGQIAVRSFDRAFMLTPVRAPDNRDPIARNDRVTTDEDVAVRTHNVLANDTDPDRPGFAGLHNAAGHVGANNPGQAPSVLEHLLSDVALRVSDFTQPEHGKVIYNRDGTFTYTSDADFHGDDIFTYTITDGRYGFSVGAVRVRVNPVEDSPTAEDVLARTRQAQQTEIRLVGFDVDPEDRLEYVIVDRPARGALSSDDGDALVIYRPDPDFSGSDTFTYKVSDKRTDSGLATVHIIVNDAPIASDDEVTTPEDVALTIDVVANDFDANADELSVIFLSQPEHGVVTANADGTVTYQPEEDFVGEDIFTYKAGDEFDESDAATVHVVVTAVNDAPVVLDRAVGGWRNHDIRIALLGWDVDGDDIEFQILTHPAHGTLSGHDDGDEFLIYTPDPGYSGIDRFTYRASDGLVESASADVSARVSTGYYRLIDLGPGYSTGDGPMAINSFSQILGKENTRIYLWDNGNKVHIDIQCPTDINDLGTVVGGHSNDAWIWENGVQTSLPGFGTSDLTAWGINNLGTIVGSHRRYPDSGGCERAYALVWRDGQPYELPQIVEGGGSYPRDINDAGLVVGSATSTEGTQHATLWENGAAYDLGRIDNRYYGSSYAYAINEYGEIVGSSEGPRTCAFLWKDGEMMNLGQLYGCSRSYAYDINNTGQVVGGQEYAFLYSDRVMYRLIDRVSFLPPNSYWRLETATAINDEGWIIGHGRNWSDDRGFLLIPLIERDSNTAPVAHDVTIEAAEDEVLKGQVAATDADGDLPTFILAGRTAYGWLKFHNDGSFEYRPGEDFNGTDNFLFKVSDGISYSDLATATIEVAARDDAPVSHAGDDFVTDLDIEAPLDGTASFDVDGDSLTYFWEVLEGSAATINNADQAIAGLICFEEGTYVIRLTVTDGDLTSSDVVRVTAVSMHEPVSPSGLTPGLRYEYYEGVWIKLPDFHTLTPLADGVVENIDISVRQRDDCFGLVFTGYIRAPSDGIYEFTVHSNDGSQLYIGGQLVIDNDGLYPGQARGSAGLKAGMHEFTLTLFEYIGSEELLVYWYGPGVSEQLGSKRLFYSADPSVDHGPYVHDLSARLEEDHAYTGQVTGGDANGDPLQFLCLRHPYQGTLTLDSDGTFTYVPESDWYGTDSFTYKAVAGGVESDSAIVRLTVESVNDMPIAYDGSAAGVQGEGLWFDIRAKDADNSWLNWYVLTGPVHGTLHQRGQDSHGDYHYQTCEYVPNPGWSGVDQFTFQVYDFTGRSNLATVTLEIEPGNDPPTVRDMRFAIFEEEQLTGMLLAEDPNGDDLTFTITYQPRYGIVEMNPDTGLFTYTPEDDFNSGDVFEFKVTDGQAESTTGRVGIQVTPINDAPAVVLAADTTSGFAPLTVHFDATGTEDPDDWSLTYTWDFGDQSPQVNGSDLQTVHHAYEIPGTYTVTLTVDDGHGGIGSATLEIDVLEQAPLAATGLSTGEQADQTLSVDTNLHRKDFAPGLVALRGQSANILDRCGLKG